MVNANHLHKRGKLSQARKNKNKINYLFLHVPTYDLLDYFWSILYNYLITNMWHQNWHMARQHLLMNLKLHKIKKLFPHGMLEIAMYDDWCNYMYDYISCKQRFQFNYCNCIKIANIK
jgi:hypothetical protein